MRVPSILTALALAGILVGGATAEPVLRWSPSHAYLQLGNEGTFSIVLDDTLTVRTIEVFIQFDPDVVATVSGGPGALFDGFNLFQGFEPETIDIWHGYAVILGNGDWTVGPGELFSWTVEGVAEGTSPVTTVSVILVPPGEEEYTEVELTDDEINVITSTSSPGAMPAAPRLGLYPNPFNPRTRVEMVLPGGGQGRLEVLDIRGHLVAQPWSGTMTASPVSVDWDGRGRDGEPLPSGVYTFRLVADQGRTASERGVLIR